MVKLLSSMKYNLLPRPLVLSVNDRHALDIAMVRFINQKIVEPCELLENQGFYSNTEEGWFGEGNP